MVEDFINKLISIMQWDEIVLVVFTIGLFTTLMLAGVSNKFKEYFIGVDGRLSIKSLVGSFIAISYTTFAGAIALAKGELPDFPMVAALIIGACFGFNSFEKYIYASKGVINPTNNDKPSETPK